MRPLNFEKRIWELFEELKNACEYMIQKHNNLLMENAKDEFEAKPTCSTCRYWRWHGTYLSDHPAYVGSGNKTGGCANNSTQLQIVGLAPSFYGGKGGELSFREDFNCHNYEEKPIYNKKQEF